jgi:hypothetical protein
VSFSDCINGAGVVEDEDTSGVGIGSEVDELAGTALGGRRGLIIPSARRLAHVEAIVAISTSTFIVSKGRFCWPETRRRRMGWEWKRRWFFRMESFIV